MEWPPAGTAVSGRRVDSMLAISRSLSGSLAIGDAVAQILASARELLEFDRVEVLSPEDADTLLVRAPAIGVDWAACRRIRRGDCSSRYWPKTETVERMSDVTQELDPSFETDRGVVERGTRSLLRVPLTGRHHASGLLEFSSPSLSAYDDEALRVGSAIAALVAIALEREHVQAAEARWQRRMAEIDALLPRLSTLRHPDEIVSLLRDLNPGTIAHDLAAVIVAPHVGLLRQHFVFGSEQVRAIDIPADVLEGQIAEMSPHEYTIITDTEVIGDKSPVLRLHLLQSGKTSVFDQMPREPLWSLFRATRLRSQVRAMIRREGAVVGGVALASKIPYAFDESDALLVRRIAMSVSLSLVHQRLDDATRRVFEANDRAQALEARVVALQRELEESRGPHAVVGNSRVWRDVLAQATRVASTDTTVLLTGESGTGKEVVARFIHHSSRRMGGPLVALNCAALPEQLLEAELFGHEKGAFTGAQAARAGRIEQAAGGSLFLDEVAEMSPNVQAKFLRVLEEREFQRLGGNRVLQADVRLIAATNRDLRARITAGEFREDLYYRLHVFAIPLPPLRERPDDVLALAEYFLNELSEKLGRGSTGLSAPARAALRDYGWPGNVRELRNVIERALILCDGGQIEFYHLVFHAGGAGAPRRAAPVAAAGPEAFSALATSPLPDEGVDLEGLERSLVERALTQAAGNKSKAARLLGLSRSQLYSRLERHGL